MWKIEIFSSFKVNLRGKHVAVNGFTAFVLHSTDGLIGKPLSQLLLSVYSPAVVSLSGSSFDSVSLLFGIYLTATFNQCQYYSKLMSACVLQHFVDAY